MPYSAPKRIGGAVMHTGEYNSSSYLIGLLNSVAGHSVNYATVIRSALRGYQIPGLENPIAPEYFTG